MYRIALNTALAWTRKERRHQSRTEPLDARVHVLVAAPGHRDPRLGWLYDQIARLDHVDRSVTLLLLDGCSYREIAETLGLTENHVGVKINRIKSRLVARSREECAHGL